MESYWMYQKCIKGYCMKISQRRVYQKCIKSVSNKGSNYRSVDMVDIHWI